MSDKLHYCESSKVVKKQVLTVICENTIAGVCDHYLPIQFTLFTVVLLSKYNG